MARTRQLAQHIPPRTAWPTLEATEPMSGDFAILEAPTDRRISEHEESFRALYYDALLHGKYSQSKWNTWCHNTGIPIQPWVETSSVIPVETLLSLELMSNICEDYIPHIGLFLEDLLWAGHHDKSLSPLAGAIASTLPLLKHGHCALYKMNEQQPRLRSTLHQSLTGHHRTPTMLWKKDGHTAEALLPIGTQYIPDVVHNLSDISSDVFIAKLLHVNEQWMAHLVLPIDNLHAETCIQVTRARIQIEWYRYRRHNAKICIEDILRERSDLLYRTIFEIQNNTD